MLIYTRIIAIYLLLYIGIFAICTAGTMYMRITIYYQYINCVTLII